MKEIINHDCKWILIYSKNSISDTYRNMLKKKYNYSITVILDDYKG